ncbi:hypothetical protein ABZZ80_02470 [Streptomyces sp. NPDC006356]
MNNAELAAIVIAARVRTAPMTRTEGGATVTVLSLWGRERDQIVDFALQRGHRRWRLDSISDAHGTEMASRTLGRRLSARLTALHIQALAHFTDRPTSP